VTTRPGTVAATIAAALACAGSGCAANDRHATGMAQPSTALRVGLVEWQILTSSRAVTAGIVTLTVTNTGTTAHDLHVTGRGLHAKTPLLAPGRSAKLAIATRDPSRLTLTCELPGHVEAGMRITTAISRPARRRRALVDKPHD
jgi:hypothetical protein